MEPTSGTVCIANIGPRQRLRRLATGAVGALAGATLLAVLLAVEAPRAARLLVALPFWAGALGILQHREKT